MKCFLCDSEVLPTLNTFIVLDTVIQLLKESKRGGSKEKRGKKKKKALYLTNRIMMENFPPNFNFIWGYLNGQLHHQEGKQLPQGGGELCNMGEEGELDEPHEERRNSFEHTTQWSIHKVKDIKKGTVKRVTHFEPLTKEHLSVDQFKQILGDIHIKYIEKEKEEEKEKTLTEALYNLNKQKEYSLVIVNLALLFVKDKKKINIYAENFSSHYVDGRAKHTYGDSLNNTNENPFPPRNRNNFQSMLMEREMYDVPFFKSILSFHFCYSFLVNFDEYLNHDGEGVGGPYKDRDAQCGTSRGELAIGRRHTYRVRGRTHHRNAETTDRLPPSDRRTIATRLNQNHNLLEKHSVSRKRKLGEMAGGELLSGGYSSGASLGDREWSAPEEGSTTDAAPSDGSDRERHPHVEHPNLGHLRNLSDLSSLSNDDPRLEHMPREGNTHAKYFLTPRKKKKKKGNKKHLYIFDVVPKSDQYKKIYLNMLSLYCDCVYLIS
ncbi:hypothetical protein PCYB_093730 [Plasmodium cynomolgi strain B]|uniref:Uncharacterized protein n=1 Tax=Plasmodium cynomolgi (strain B) TaxID=1120755 RepID=K6UK81_PLACD|nr:hypothetical protein PCYB_093730 [Plasmodium cynomolgi strain B]GAB66588.1 hypothetical protein PCYB_093730 [Plasmodium cynomolgi strain B]